jgi:hypothetical protein
MIINVFLTHFLYTEYCVVSHPNVLGGAHLIIAKALVETLEKKFGVIDAEV